MFLPPPPLILPHILALQIIQLIHQHGASAVGASTEAMLPIAVIVRILKDVAAGGAYLHRRRYGGGLGCVSMHICVYVCRRVRMPVCLQ